MKQRLQLAILAALSVLSGSAVTQMALLPTGSEEPFITSVQINRLPPAGLRQTQESTFRVGPHQRYRTPSAVARMARDGDLVEIEAGLYSGDVAIWRQNNLILRGIDGRAHLDAAGIAAEDKAIWVLKGNNVTVENMEFSGTRVPNKNGAGIRFEGSNLTVRNSYFHDNEMGILTGGNSASEILIEGSEFAANTVDYPRYGRLGHNIYIGRVKRFTLRGSYIHQARTGHNVKSRARHNRILYNRIMDESGGSSYLVDLPEGGNAVILGNLLQQSRDNENYALISFAAEANQDRPGQSLDVVNNTLVNDFHDGVFVFNHSVAPAQLVNNIFVGPGRPLLGPGVTRHKLVSEHVGLKDRGGYDYRLRPHSPAIDAGIDPGTAPDGFSLVPRFHYIHPTGLEPRPIRGRLDLGAYEFSPSTERGVE